MRLAARLTGWKLDIKKSTEYDQAAEDAVVAELISLREEEEALQQEAEERIAVEQAARAEEDARLRELYPRPEDDENYGAGAAFLGVPVAEFVEGEPLEDAEGDLAVSEEMANPSDGNNQSPLLEANIDAETDMSEDAR